ncbi:hypothetical protein CEXT_389591 [Caerostris extrusa]|uniref:Uncharacterized protein n=1 Tax=Caerostris extrusa TaxID=172846 RepID=A0AAV4WV70_CAEEX|nr:hypothetical protein CEXT_389591 [Caerostris extrusa]
MPESLLVGVKEMKKKVQILLKYHLWVYSFQTVVAKCRRIGIVGVPGNADYSRSINERSKIKAASKFERLSRLDGKINLQSTIWCSNHVETCSRRGLWKGMEGWSDMLLLLLHTGEVFSRMDASIF